MVTHTTQSIHKLCAFYLRFACPFTHVDSRTTCLPFLSTTFPRKSRKNLPNNMSASCFSDSVSRRLATSKLFNNIILRAKLGEKGDENERKYNVWRVWNYKRIFHRVFHWNIFDGKTCILNTNYRKYDVIRIIYFIKWKSMYKISIENIHDESILIRYYLWFHSHAKKGKRWRGIEYCTIYIR